MKIAFDTPDAGTPASAQTEFPSAEAVHATLIQCACVACPFTLGTLAPRTLTIERINKETGLPAVSSTYAIPAVGDKDRALTFNIDVAVFPRHALKAYINDCAPGETQWIVINYDAV